MPVPDVPKVRVDTETGIKNFEDSLKSLNFERPVELLKAMAFNRLQMSFTNGKISPIQSAISSIRKIETNAKSMFEGMRYSKGAINNMDDFEKAIFTDLIKSEEKKALLAYVNKPTICFSRAALIDEVNTVVSISRHITVGLPGDCEDLTGYIRTLNVLGD